MQKYLFGLLLLSSLVTFGSSFIVPQEIPSLLSLVYSNIPPIKKGTDSRIGFGYRLGDHADFQVQFEIGPQKETQAIGGSSAGKREIQPADNFYVEKAVRKEKVKQELGSSQPGSWLKNWFQGMQNEKYAKVTEAPAIKSPMISEAAFSQLQELYRSSSVAEESNSSEHVTELGVLPAQEQSPTSSSSSTIN